MLVKYIIVVCKREVFWFNNIFCNWSHLGLERISLWINPLQMTFLAFSPGVVGKNARCCWSRKVKFLKESTHERGRWGLFSSTRPPRIPVLYGILFILMVWQKATIVSMTLGNFPFFINGHPYYLLMSRWFIFTRNTRIFQLEAYVGSWFLHGWGSVLNILMWGGQIFSSIAGP